MSDPVWMRWGPISSRSSDAYGCDDDPLAFSFFLASNLPVDESSLQRLLQADNVVERLQLIRKYPLLYTVLCVYHRSLPPSPPVIYVQLSTLMRGGIGGWLVRGAGSRWHRGRRCLTCPARRVWRGPTSIHTALYIKLLQFAIFCPPQRSPSKVAPCLILLYYLSLFLSLRLSLRSRFVVPGVLLDHRQLRSMLPTPRLALYRPPLAV